MLTGSSENLSVFTAEFFPGENFMSPGSISSMRSTYSSSSSSSSGPPKPMSRKAQQIHSLTLSRLILSIGAPRCQSETYLTGLVIVEIHLLNRSRRWLRVLASTFRATPCTACDIGKYTARKNRDSARSHASSAVGRR